MRSQETVLSLTSDQLKTLTDALTKSLATQHRLQILLQSIWIEPLKFSMPPKVDASVVLGVLLNLSHSNQLLWKILRNGQRSQTSFSSTSKKNSTPLSELFGSASSKENLMKGLSSKN